LTEEQKAAAKSVERKQRAKYVRTIHAQHVLSKSKYLQPDAINNKKIEEFITKTDSMKKLIGTVIRNFVHWALKKELAETHEKVAKKGMKQVRKAAQKDSTLNAMICHLFQHKVYAEHVTGEYSRENLADTIQSYGRMQFDGQSNKTTSLRRFITLKVDQMFQPFCGSSACFKFPAVCNHRFLIDEQRIPSTSIPNTCGSASAVANPN